MLKQNEVSKITSTSNSTNVAKPTHIYHSPGKHKIKLYYYIDSILEDTLFAEILITKGIDTNKSVTICEGDSFYTGKCFLHKSGIYYDTFSCYNGCDSIEQINLFVNPRVRTALNPKICEGDVFIMGTNNYNKEGNYSDTFVSYYGCDSIVNTKLHISHPKINFLPKDTSVCFENGQLLQLDAGIATDYLWYPSLETGRYQNVKSEGIYKVEIKDSIGCKSIDSTEVLNICRMIIFIPNAFYPDGINTVFKVYGQSIKQIELEIFSRWGELIYKSKGGDETSWNGKFHNDLCPDGVYYYSINAIGKNGETKYFYGLVQLLR